MQNYYQYSVGDDVVAIDEAWSKTYDWYPEVGTHGVVVSVPVGRKYVWVRWEPGSISMDTLWAIGIDTIAPAVRYKEDVLDDVDLDVDISSLLFCE